jgi:hypothetical protein
MLSHICSFAAPTGVHFSFHDLRATCATGAGRPGAAPHAVALLLGRQGVPGTLSMTSRYDHADRLPEVRRAHDSWDSHVQRLIKRARSSEVTTLRRSSVATDPRNTLEGRSKSSTASIRLASHEPPEAKTSRPDEREG